MRTGTAVDQPRGEAPSAPQRRLAAEIRGVASLSQPDIAEMFALYASYYDGTALALFERDLDEKNWAVILRSEDGALAGFSTLAILNQRIKNADVRVIYSGDTIIDRAHWGTQALAFTWIRFAGTVKAEAPTVPLYWFLIVKGHRTYRYLSTFSIDFFPHWERPTPPWARDVMDELASRKFGDAYRPQPGVVSFPQSHGHLKPDWATIAPEELARPDVAFFLRSNPGYRRGDELVCLTELAPDNLRPIARRVFTQGMAG